MPPVEQLGWVKKGSWIDSTKNIFVPLFQVEMDVRVHAEPDEMTGKQIEALQQLITITPDYRPELTHHLNSRA